MRKTTNLIKKDSKNTRSAAPKTKLQAKGRKSGTSKPTSSRTSKPKVEKGALLRLNKYIADSGFCSRRKADELIASGQVKVNGAIIIDLGTKVQTDANVTVNGDPISYYVKHKYILMNKPKDVITTTNDEKGRPTVLDLIKSKTDRLYPVGRLDRNTTGCLLITNDGEMAHRLTHPSYQVERVYLVGLDKPLSFKDAEKITQGVELEDGMTGPCELFINPKDKTQLNLSLREGKNREVRRIFEALGYEVKKLHRKYFATLDVSGMKRGEYRLLTSKEIAALRNYCKM